MTLQEEIARLRHDNGDPATLRSDEEFPYRMDREPTFPWEGNGPCEDCGDRNPSWHTGNDIWAQVVGDEVGLVLCPTCFVIRAHAVGVDPGAWYLTPQEPRFVLANDYDVCVTQRDAAINSLLRLEKVKYD